MSNILVHFKGGPLHGKSLWYPPDQARCDVLISAYNPSDGINPEEPVNIQRFTYHFHKRKDGAFEAHGGPA